MLSRRSYSEEELREKLARFAAAEEIGEVLESCRRRNYLNDRRLADFLADKYLEKGKGYFYISAILEKRGIPGGIIDNLKEDFDFKREFGIAEDFFLKNRKKKKLSSLLFSLKNRGFSFTTINKLMDKYGKELNGQQSDKKTVSGLF